MPESWSSASARFYVGTKKAFFFSPLTVRLDLFVSLVSILRPQYFKIIDECVSQIVLHRSGTDPDFGYRKRLDVDFSHLLGKLHICNSCSSF